MTSYCTTRYVFDNTWLNCFAKMVQKSSRENLISVDAISCLSAGVETILVLEGLHYLRMTYPQ